MIPLVFIETGTLQQFLSTRTNERCARPSLPCYVLKSDKVPITGYARMMNVQYFTGIQNKV
jgi:hypothetical protein